METNVIQIPKSKIQSFQKRMSDRFHERKGSVAVSIAAVLVFSLFMNQWLISPAPVAGVGASSRGIASVGSREDYVNKVKWEHEMADEIADSKLAGAHLAVRPSLRDELLFGMLAGRYGVQMEQGRVLGLSWTNTDSNGEPIQIKGGDLFLNEYKNVWAVSFSQIQLSQKTPQQEVYNLMDSQGASSGQAQLDFDQDGRLLAIKFIK